MGFFKSLFSSNQTSIRHLDHPKQLVIGDLITFDNVFSLPDQLRDASFEVVDVNTYEHEFDKYHECVLKSGDNKQINLVAHTGDQEYISLSCAITADWVERIFNMDQFSAVFEEGLSRDVEAQKVEPISQWLSEHYRKVTDAKIGYFYPEKLDLTKLDEAEDAEQFQLYQLESTDEQFGVDIEVWEDGDTDVFLLRYFPLNVIKEFWPKEQAQTQSELGSDD